MASSFTHGSPDGQPMQSPERATELLTMAVEFLAMVPSHVWDHRSLPVPIEDIADLGRLRRRGASGSICRCWIGTTSVI